jgi:hypothetical protein
MGQLSDAQTVSCVVGPTLLGHIVENINCDSEETIRGKAAYRD